MNAELKAAQDDLAYLKGLVQGTGSQQRLTGKLFLAGGLLYGGECAFHWAQSQGVIHPSGLVTLIVVVAISVVFLAILTAAIISKRGESQGGTASRAVNAAFTAAGATNAVMIVVFGLVAAAHHSLTIWLLYPCVVCALQGAAWLISAQVNRRVWHGGVALGWFATTIAMALTIATPPLYSAVVGLGLILWMAVPGYVLMRTAQAD